MEMVPNPKNIRFLMKKEFIYTSEEIFSLFASLNPETRPPRHKVQFRSITNSSLEVEPDSLFIPLIGERDGHDFIRDALQRGASGFLCNRNHRILDSLSRQEREKGIEVDHTLRALGILANHHRKKFNAHVVAITGSSGKTTTKEFFRSCLSSLSSCAFVCTEKNFNNEIGLPFTLFDIQPNTEIVVLEMGMNHRGEIERLSRIAEPHTMMITTIGSAHIENLGSPEAIAWEKSDITVGARGQDSTKLKRDYKPILYVPEDLAFSDIVEENAKKNHVPLKYWNLPWLNPSSAFRICSSDHTGYKLEFHGNMLEWNMPGSTILSNLIGTITILYDLGFEIQDLFRGIQTYKPEGNRLKPEQGNKYRVINDTYNANPESMQSSISIVRQLSNGKDFCCILGDMKELGNFSEFYHRQVGAYLAKSEGAYLATYGTDSRFILDEFLKTSKNEGKTKSAHFPLGEYDSLLQWIQTYIPNEILILCKGSRSMRMETIVEKILAI